MRAELSRVGLTSATRALPATDPSSFFAANPTGTRALWLRPASGEALVGLGAAVEFTGSPEQVAPVWRDWLSRGDVDARLRLLGGFAFDPLAPSTLLWDGFAQGQLVLPEQLLSVQGERAWLTVNDTADAAPAHVPADKPSPPPGTGLEPDAWQDLVREVAAFIRHGGSGVRKVVLARAAHVRVRTSVEMALRRLVAKYPTCTIFAFASGDACFLGATPERLVAAHDGTATTMALAGSAPRGGTPDEDRAIADRLLHDPKELHEHALVADALREALAPLAARVIGDAEPRVHALPNVQHLITPVRAQLTEDRGVLDLVHALHPTPAVGGYPRTQALDVIREREGLDRGWYAGPIGWVDARGEGEFVVGLRSALVRGETATLFAGCGIVADSDPATEYAEWGWKLRPMAMALGIDDGANCR